MAPDSRPNQDGLAWKDTLFDLVPQWTRDPSIAAIETLCRQRLAIAPADPCLVTFATSGLFNKLYTVEPRGTKYMMRVTLPVYPRHKTRAEVATLRWVGDNTSIPVPRVYDFDDGNDNEIGFEWILMEFMPGKPAHERWWTMTMEQKVAFAQRIATFQSELSGSGKAESLFERIGSLTLDWPASGLQKDAAAGAPVALGQLVTPEFFMGDNLFYRVPRGPFRSSHDWLAAQLNIIMLHQTAILNKTDDEDEREESEMSLSVARKLLSLVPKVFPPSPEVAETTGLYHHDLHLNNILVSDQGDITAVLDWECVSALPLWMATSPPKFLDEPVREEEPLAEIYAPPEAAADAQKGGSSGHEKNDLYYIHRMEYEATQLRKVYEVKLKELWPGWPQGKCNAEMDFYQAVSLCDGPWVRRVRKWADRLEKGEVVRLDMTRPGFS